MTFTSSSVSKQTDQRTPVKPQSTAPISSESFFTSNSDAVTTATNKRQTAETITTTDMPFTSSLVSKQTQSRTPVKPQSTTPISSEYHVTSDSGTQTDPKHFPRFSPSIHLQVTNNNTAAMSSENIINPQWFYFLSVLIIPIGVCFVYLYKKGVSTILCKNEILSNNVGQTLVCIYLQPIV